MQRLLLRGSCLVLAVVVLLVVAGPAERVFSQTSIVTVTRQVGTSADDVYEEGAAYTGNATVLWIGNGGSTSYTGLRFTGLAVPPGALVTSSHLEVYSTGAQWLSWQFNIAAEASGNSPAFSSVSRPSQRTVTSASVGHADNLRWLANTWYSLDEMAGVVQEVVNRPDWRSGNSLSVVLRGTGGAWSRKQVRAYDGATTFAAKLVVSYRPGAAAAATATATTTATATAAPTATATPTATETATPTETPVGPAEAVATPTVTPTGSATPTITTTATITATATATPSPSATSAPGASGPEWAQHAHDAQRTSYTAQVVNTPWRWTWAWNGPNASGAVSTGKFGLPHGVQPVTGGGRVYVAAGTRGVFALSEATGAVQWNASAVGTINSTAAYDADTSSVFVLSTAGVLYRLNAADGTVAGQFNTGGASTLPLPPALLTDRVLLAMGTGVFAIDKRALTQIWRYEAGSPVHTPPAYSASRNRVVVASQDLYVHAIDNGTGAAAWRVKPTVRTPGDPAAGPNRLAEVSNGWPVVAERHGLVLIKVRLDWDTLWTWSPWPTGNTTMRSNLQARPEQQALFALSLDTGLVPFVANIGHGGMGDGGYLPMGPQPVVKSFADGTEVAYTVIRGNTGTDGRWDSKFGELMLDGTTVPGFGAGDVRFIYYDPSGRNSAWPAPVVITDEQPNVAMAGDFLFGGHWMAGYTTQIADRSGTRGSFASPITTLAVPQITNSSTSCGFSASHYCPNGVTQDGDPRFYGPSGFYIYSGQPGVYNTYASGYATWLVSNSTLYFLSTDGAVVAFRNGNPTALASASASAPSLSTGMAALGEGLTAAPVMLARLFDRPVRSEARSAETPVIPGTRAEEYVGQVATVEGTIGYVFNNRQAVYLRFANVYQGGFVVRIMEQSWGAFERRPDLVYRLGQRIRVTGPITWYRGDPVIYVEDPAQIVASAD